MRALFLFLLLGNAAFYAWVNYLRTPVSPQERIEQVQMSPEKIRLAAAPVSKKPAVPSARPAPRGRAPRGDRRPER